MPIVNSLIERCVELIELLAEKPEAFPLAVIGEKMGLERPGLRRLLDSLRAMGWVEHLPEADLYRLTLRLAILGLRILRASGAEDVLRSVISRVAKESGELVRLAIIDGRRLCWSNYAQGRRHGLIFQPATVGRVSLETTATGRAWLATFPLGEALDILGDDLTRRDIRGRQARQVVADFPPIWEEVRQRGWSMSYEEAEGDLVAVGAAISPGGAHAQAVGCCSIIAPRTYVTDEKIENNAKLLLEAASELAGLWTLRAVSFGSGLAANNVVNIRS